MAQEAPGVQLHNTRLLIIACVLALVVVVVYNVRVGQLKNQGKEIGAVKVMLTKEVLFGETLKPEYYKEVPVSREGAQLLKDVVDAKELRLNDDLLKKPFNRSVPEGKWLRHEYLIDSVVSGPATELPRGMSLLAVRVDEKTAPGDTLRSGGRINLMANLPDDNNVYRHYRVIEGMTVRAIEGKSQTERSGSGYSSGAAATSFRRVHIVVREDVSPVLLDVQNHAERNVFQVEVVNPLSPLPNHAGSISPEVLKLLPALNRTAARRGSLNE